MSFRKIKADFSVPISSFPESLHPLLKEIDGPDGNGALETDELTEVFEMYAAAKKANEEGCIALKSLPQELQKTLEVFDVDGDGTVGTTELARAAELYKDSNNMVKRLTKAVAILFLVMIALVGTIVGLTAHVIESSKETETGDSGITYVKGSNTPSATAGVLKQSDLSEAYAYSEDELDNMKSLRLSSLDLESVYSYTITGWTRNQTTVAFYASRGDVITVGSDGEIVVTDAEGSELLKVSISSRRKLLRGRGAFLSTVGLFTLSSGGGGSSGSGR
ncbi:unnamed protein product [Bathycoccus prasinos]